MGNTVDIPINVRYWYFSIESWEHMRKRITPYKHINLHHSTANEKNAQRIREIHMGPPTNFGDIGYNAVVRPDGVVEMGRSTVYEGAHNPGMSPDGVNTMNAVAFAVVFIGNFEDGGMGETQFRAGVKFVAEKCIEFKLAPTSDVIRPHKADYATKCPGKNFPYERFVSEVAKMVKGGPTVKKVVVIFTSGDSSVGDAVAKEMGGIAVFNRYGGSSVHPDALAAEVKFTIGGPPLGVPGEVHMSGNSALDTLAAVVSKYREGKLK